MLAQLLLEILEVLRPKLGCKSGGVDPVALQRHQGSASELTPEGDLLELLVDCVKPFGVATEARQIGGSGGERPCPLVREAGTLQTEKALGHFFDGQRCVSGELPGLLKHVRRLLLRPLGLVVEVAQRDLGLEAEVGDLDGRCNQLFRELADELDGMLERPELGESLDDVLQVFVELLGRGGCVLLALLDLVQTVRGLHKLALETVRLVGAALEHGCHLPLKVELELDCVSHSAPPRRCSARGI